MGSNFNFNLRPTVLFDMTIPTVHHQQYIGFITVKCLRWLALGNHTVAHQARP